MSLEKAEEYLKNKGMLDHVIRLEDSTATVVEAAQALGVEPGTTSGNGGSSYGNSGGYGSYQGGSMAGSSKTGDVRPFKMMAVLGLIGMGLLTGGVVIYRRTVSGKRNIKGMPRK